ncbi:S-layer homology domain-containing protein [Bengtsoniella intestinalis]
MSNVTDGIYDYASVMWAVEHGITTGYSDSNFQPTPSATEAPS